MINKARLIINDKTDPWWNLSIEEYLLDNVEQGECILYLWQNQHTIVIGRNQHAFLECNVIEFQQAKGKIARRPSGGGAVYHDLGNLNFTFIMRKEDYDLNRQLSVILDAVKKLGANAVRSGRNDITIDDRKFSGNAFYTKGDRSYHHGTIMLDVDLDPLFKYLTPSAKKLNAKGVSSVKSRVCNLIDHVPGLSLNMLIEALKNSFFEKYPLDNSLCDTYNCRHICEHISDEITRNKRVVELYEKYSSLSWNLGNDRPFTISKSKRFDFGEITLRLNIDSNKVCDVQIYSDAMDIVLFEQISLLAKLLLGKEFSKSAFEIVFKHLEQSEQTKEKIEFISWLINIF